MYQRHSLRHIMVALCLVFSILVLGCIGYMLIEHFSFLDALFTTVEMMATLGNPAHELSDSGREFTIAVIVLGVGSLFYTFGATMEFVIEGHLSRAIGRHMMEKKIAKLRQHCIICGFGRVGSHIAREFVAAHTPFVVIDANETTVQRCLQQGYLVLQGDAASDEVLQQAGIQYAQALLVATDQDANNIFITLSARNLNPHLCIVARANHDETVVKLTRAGADRVLSPYTIGGHKMANLALHPTVVDFFDTLIDAENATFTVQEVVLQEHSPLIGKTIGEAQKMLTDGIMILAVKKDSGLVMGSRLDMRIETGDTALLAGSPLHLAGFAQQKEPPQLLSSS
jgi:voltage-gated potassium channel